MGWYVFCMIVSNQLFKEPAMSIHKPFDPDRPLFSSRCSCGLHASESEHHAAQLRKADVEEDSANFIEASLVKALFPQESRRRAFLKAVGAGGAMSALSGFLPVGSLQAMAQEKAPLEKKDLSIGFIAITCATPLIMADPLGFYKKQGLNVTLNKTAGWALIRDKMLNREHDASHFLSPMPISMSMGLGSDPSLRAGNIDGFLGPDPFNQRAVYDEVGFITILTKDIWDGHPCCAFGTSEEFIKKNPNTFAALYRAVINASTMARNPENRPLIAKVISPQNYLNQPETVVMQVLTGKFADGLGNVQNVPDRIDFNPIPWYSMATWMLTQMQRWGYVKGDVNYKDISEKVFLLTDAKKYMQETNAPITAQAKANTGNPKFRIMGKEFDPATAAAYSKSFAISKS